MARPAIHPGEILAEELAEIAVTPTELARQLRVPANRITQIVHGKRAITGDIVSDFEAEELVDRHLNTPFAYPQLRAQLRQAAIKAVIQYRRTPR